MFSFVDWVNTIVKISQLTYILLSSRINAISPSSILLAEFPLFIQYKIPWRDFFGSFKFSSKVFLITSFNFWKFLCSFVGSTPYVSYIVIPGTSSLFEYCLNSCVWGWIP